MGLFERLFLSPEQGNWPACGPHPPACVHVMGVLRSCLKYHILGLCSLFFVAVGIFKWEFPPRKVLRSLF